MVKDKISLILRIFAIVMCSIFITSRMLTESLAKYTTSATSFDQARVAKFIDINKDINVTSSGDTVIYERNINFNPGDTDIVDFTIINSGETTVRVELNIESYNTLPLSFYINDELVSTTSFILEPNDSVGKKISFKIVWPEELNDFTYSNTSDYISIYAKCSQVD